MLKTLHHPHIVPYLDHFWDDSDQALYLVMAFCDCGDLLGLIERQHRLQLGICPGIWCFLLLLLGLGPASTVSQLVS